MLFCPAFFTGSSPDCSDTARAQLSSCVWLAGAIPSELGGLSALEGLYLAENELSGEETESLVLFGVFLFHLTLLLM